MFGVVRRLFDEDQNIPRTFSCSKYVRHVLPPRRTFQRTNEIFLCVQAYIRNFPTKICIVLRRFLNLNHFWIRPYSILIISMLHSYLSHKSGKVMRVCILYLLASALAPFHCKIFVEMLVRVAKRDEQSWNIWSEVLVEMNCSLKCSSRLIRA